MNAANYLHDRPRFPSGAARPVYTFDADELEAIDAARDDGDALLEMVELGWTVFSKTRSHEGDFPVGGVVVDHGIDGNGERFFLTCDAHRGRVSFPRVEWSDVDTGTIALPNAATLRGRARQLQATASRKKGTAGLDDLELARYALVLLELTA